jgi:hypothetical protein
MAIMKKYNWHVGVLKEMPPEGLVGISERCILGYNLNRGEVIALRLRTDDLKGFRNYNRIIETSEFQSLSRSHLLNEINQFHLIVIESVL